MSATDPRPTTEQLTPLKLAAKKVYRTGVTDDAVSSYQDDRPNLGYNAAREAVGIALAVDEVANPLVAHGLEHAAEFLRTRDVTNMHPAAVSAIEAFADEFTARAAALLNGDYETEEQPA